MQLFKLTSSSAKARQIQQRECRAGLSLPDPLAVATAEAGPDTLLGSAGTQISSQSASDQAWYSYRQQAV